MDEKRNTNTKLVAVRCVPIADQLLYSNDCELVLMYTKRHFESVAAILLNFRDEHADTPEGAKAYGWLVNRFTTTFRISNPRFDSGRFHKACGWSEYLDSHYEKMMERERGRTNTT